MKITIEIYIFELVSLSNFSLNKQFWFFETIFSNKDTSKQIQKNDHHHWIIHIRISQILLWRNSFKFWDQIYPKQVSSFKNRKKKNITIGLGIFELIEVPNFSLNRKFLFFWPNLPKKGIFGQKRKNWITIAFCIFELLWLPNFTLHKQFWNLRQNLPKKGIFDQKWKSGQFHGILHIRISLGTKFNFKQTILNIGTKFALKGYFRSKTKTVNISIEYCIFELV